MLRHSILVGVVALSATRGAWAVPRWVLGPDAVGSPTVTEHRIRRGDLTLRYRVHWPARSDEPAPVVLGLHGRTHSPPLRPFHMLAISQHDPYGEAIVVAPLVDWDAPWTEMQPMIMRALREVARTRAIDRDRVAVAGFSMGSSSALYLARNRPRTFSAVFAATGRFPRDALDDLADRRTRVLLSWSGSPRRCHEAEALARRIEARGGHARAVVFPDGEHEAHLELLADPERWRWWIGARPAALESS